MRTCHVLLYWSSEKYFGSRDRNAPTTTRRGFQSIEQRFRWTGSAPLKRSLLKVFKSLHSRENLEQKKKKESRRRENKNRSVESNRRQNATVQTAESEPVASFMGSPCKLSSAWFEIKISRREVILCLLKRKSYGISSVWGEVIRTVPAEFRAFLYLGTLTYSTRQKHIIHIM